jgi:hypothetical protein
MYPGDPVTMREETRAILLRGELAVSDRVVREYSSGEPGQYIVDNPRNGRSYSKYGRDGGLVLSRADGPGEAD